MTWDDRCCIARVRVLAIEAELRAGGEPTRARLARAIAPLLADVQVDPTFEVAPGRASAPPGRRRLSAAPKL